jgi:hypothetical protein
MELPNAPFYRRWSFLLATVIGLAAVTALFGWLNLQGVAGPSPPTTVPATTAAPPTTAPATSSTTTSKPDDLLWEADEKDGGVVRSDGFRAPVSWRIVWEFDCSNFREHGGGNFKITGDGALQGIAVQATAIEDSGTRSFNRSGVGHLLVESVCETWSVTVLSN